MIWSVFADRMQDRRKIHKHGRAIIARWVTNVGRNGGRDGRACPK